ncbi:MAG: hypothetical protein LBU73_06265 [Helicobacteraceae bacterium]|jgi:hypothetical protein|nr:hypothetical protein [Helicobacteraceae bacterium]
MPTFTAPTFAAPVKFSIDRAVFRKCLAEALIASAKTRAPLTIFYNLADGGFDYANTPQSSQELLPIVEIDAKTARNDLPFDDLPALENLLKNEEETIFQKMLPELVERLAPIMAARNGVGLI